MVAEHILKKTNQVTPKVTLPYPYPIFSLNLKVKDELLVNSCKDTKFLGKVTDLKLSGDRVLIHVNIVLVK